MNSKSIIHDIESSQKMSEDELRRILAEIDTPLFIKEDGTVIPGSQERFPSPSQIPAGMIGILPAVPIDSLGDAAFRQTYGTRYACYAGAMANGISSVELVCAMGKAGFMASFGSAGLSPAKVEEAILRVQTALPGGPYAFNLINSPAESGLERSLVGLYIKHQIRLIEASAYLRLTPDLVYYRAAGLSADEQGNPVIANRIIAKVSRQEVAQHFMNPAPADILQQLLSEGKISALQADLAARIPVADDITVEADSGGHTDNRPLVCLMPGMLALRDQVQRERKYPQRVRIGAAGGISTPGAALAAFMMGAAYIVTGSINQACIESGASTHTRSLLAQAGMADVIMAPAADMFEMGVRVQVLKRGTMFAMRAKKLYDLYTRFASIEEIPAEEKERLEKQTFKRGLDSIWDDTAVFFGERDPKQIERASADPRHKMALIFRWYLGLSSRWPMDGEPGREMDYQIWCGPAMGAFNDWVRGTYLEDIHNRRVVDVNLHILSGAAMLWRANLLKMSAYSGGVEIESYRPSARLD